MEKIYYERRIIINDLELAKQIKKANKIAKDKYITLQSRTKRKLRIKEKKYIKKDENVRDEDL